MCNGRRLSYCVYTLKASPKINKNIICNHNFYLLPKKKDSIHILDSDLFFKNL